MVGCRKDTKTGILKVRDNFYWSLLPLYFQPEVLLFNVFNLFIFKYCLSTFLKEREFMEDLKKWIRVTLISPLKEFYLEIKPFVAEPKALSPIKGSLQETIKPLNADYVAGIDARGFLFCTLVAENLGLGALMIRKPNKLPGELIEKSYELEYGNQLTVQRKI